jgi:hypothetical protein
MEVSGQLQAQAFLRPAKNWEEAGSVYWGVLSDLEKWLLVSYGLVHYCACCSGTVEVLMVVTTRISVSMYRCSRVVIVPVIGLYIVVVM